MSQYHRLLLGCISTQCTMRSMSAFCECNVASAGKKGAVGDVEANAT